MTSTVPEFDEVFSEGQEPKAESTVVSLRAQRNEQEQAATGEFLSEFDKEQPAAGTDKGDQ
jgi:hypothetical protein